MIRVGELGGVSYSARPTGGIQARARTRDAGGNLRRISATGTTREAAYAKLVEEARVLALLRTELGGLATLSELLDTYLDAKRASGRVREQTLTAYARTARHLKEVGGALPVADLTPGRVQELLGRVVVVGSRALREIDAGRGSGVIVSQAWLGLRLGMTPNAGWRALRELKRLGWLREVKRLDNGAAVYKIGRLGPDARVADEWADVVDAIATGTAADLPLAEVIMLGASPAWGGPDVPGPAWMTAVCDAARFGPGERQSLGMARQLTAARTWLRTETETHGSLTAAIRAREAELRPVLEDRARALKDDAARRREEAAAAEVLTQKARRWLIAQGITQPPAVSGEDLRH